MKSSQKLNTPVNRTILVAALGYFVDIYDLQLFNIIGKPSIMSEAGLGIKDPALVTALFDDNLFYWQMAGMLFGGLLWGVWGDLKGRKSILFGSILLYSLANIANAFVTTIPQYQFVRFVAGLGLAGELGAAITLVSEIMTKENRGWGTALIVTLGALGAVVAAIIANLNIAFWGLEAWQTAYILGGMLGLTLLFLRFGTFESGMFEEAQKQKIKKGDFLMLLTNRKRFIRYLHCIAIGLPVWYVIGVLIKLAPRFSEQIGITDGKIGIANTIMMAYIGLSLGDLVSGWLSQVLKSRKKVIFIYLISNVILVTIYLNIHNLTTSQFYALALLLGMATGYWALFVTIAAEQFGTNIRATATTTIPNFVRGAVIPISKAFFLLLGFTSSITSSAVVLGVICIGLAAYSTYAIEETFGKNLDYLE